jgi:hypothetical protein
MIDMNIKGVLPENDQSSRAGYRGLAGILALVKMTK